MMRWLMATAEQEITKVLRGKSEVFTESDLRSLLASKKKLKIYYGVDPSGPQIHLGHAVVLRKLALFQKMGHKIIFLIGDFTGMIGDPTDRAALRQPLTRKQVLENAKTYKRQVSRFLTFGGKNPAVVRFNSGWNDRMGFKQVIDLAGKFTVQQFMERDMFQKRAAAGKPIGLHEFLYPLVQGYDAVKLGADIQVGGTDQTFNMLQGRYLAKTLRGRVNVVITYQLLVGSDGRKMSKSFGNVINIEDSAAEMFGKIMSVRDELIGHYFLLATELSEADMATVLKLPNPRDQKMRLAEEVVSLYHGDHQAVEAKNAFIRQFREGKLPVNIRQVSAPAAKLSLSAVLVAAGLAESKSQARRLISQGGVKLEGRAATSDEEVEFGSQPKLVQVGKRKFSNIVWP